MKSLPLLLLVVLGSPALQASPQVEMHRVQVSSEDKWHLATSTKGHFSVLAPGPFNDFTASQPTPAGQPAIKIHTVGGVTENGLKFSATKIPASLSSGVSVEEFPEKMRRQGDSIKVLEKTFSGEKPSISFMIEGASGGAFVRYNPTPSGDFLLTLEYPVQLRADASELASKFLPSLELEQISPD